MKIVREKPGGCYCVRVWKLQHTSCRVSQRDFKAELAGVNSKLFVCSAILA